MDCIFCKIAHREIATPLIYEDDDVVAFNDINPKAPIHFLIIPKKHIVSLELAGTENQHNNDENDEPVPNRKGTHLSTPSG